MPIGTAKRRRCPSSSCKRADPDGCDQLGLNARGAVRVEEVRIGQLLEPGEAKGEAQEGTQGHERPPREGQSTRRRGVEADTPPASAGSVGAWGPLSWHPRVSIVVTRRLSSLSKRCPETAGHSMARRHRAAWRSLERVACARTWAARGRSPDGPRHIVDVVRRLGQRNTRPAVAGRVLPPHWRDSLELCRNERPLRSVAGHELLVVVRAPGVGEAESDQHRHDRRRGRTRRSHTRKRWWRSG